MAAANREPAGVTLRGSAARGKQGAMLAFAPNWPLRVTVFRGAGAVAILAASALWLLPGAADAGEMQLFRLGISVFFFFCGFALLVGNYREATPDAWFDPVGREVRVVQKDARGNVETVLRRSYDSLGRVQFTQEGVDLFERDGTLLMSLAIDNEAVGASLRAQLGEAG